MKPIQTASIAAPGFLGLNTQDSSVQLSSGFALTANNCIIDRYGRIGARRGWTPVNSTINTDLGSGNAVEFMFEMVQAGGNVMLSAGNNKLFTGTTTMTTAAVRNQANTANLTYTITANHWQGAALPFGDGADAEPHTYLVQAAHEPLVYHKMPVSGSGATFSVTTIGGGGAITAVSVTAAGSGYNIGDVLTIAGGTGTDAKFTVATLTGTGIATVTLTEAGTGYTASDALTSTVTTNIDPHSHDGSLGFQRLGDVGTLPLGYTTTDFKPNCALAAYGRIWLADIIGDRQTVYFSRLLDGSDFSGGDSGSLSLNAVFPNNDKIVALAAHNGFLIVFGRNNIAIYGNPIDVTQLTLIEYIPNVGCIARDSVVSTGTDLIFLSDAGVRSLTRVIQEKSLPFRDLSKNVRDELIANAGSETNVAAIKGIYFNRDAFYLLALPTSKIVYCFDTRQPMQDGSYRVTKWDSIEPRSFVITDSKDLYLGRPGYIGRYFGHTDNSAIYRMQYFTNHFDFEQPNALKILKKIGLVVIGGSNANVAVKYGFDYSENFRAVTKSLGSGVSFEYNIAEYNIAEYAGGIVLEKFFLNVSGNGAIIQLGIETDINGNPFSLQKIDVGTKMGKVII
jgi:hypothetical protein